MKMGVSAVIFEGSNPCSTIEKIMVDVRQAALLDNLEKMKKVGCLERIYLHTNRPELVEPATSLGAEVTLNSLTGEQFHFGNELKAVIKKHRLDRVFCLNGAGCPLITVNELEMICRKLTQRDRFVYTNNTQSADMVAFTVTADLQDTELPAMDNSLALTLRDQLGLEMELMPHSLGLLFDIDTPTDLLVLGAGPFCDTRTRQMLDKLSLDYSTLEKAKAVLSAEYEDVVLIGRVGAPIIGRLNELLKLRLRVFSEERGMKSLGRIDKGQVISLLGLLLEHAGLHKFFRYLPELARCAFIDSRVLMYHYKLELSDSDRFLSDLGCWEQVENPWLKEFTRLAKDCPIPVVLGGHSLVSGSMWALCEELAPTR